MGRPGRPYIVVSRKPRVQRTADGRMFVNGVEYVRPGQPSPQVRAVTEANLRARGK